MKINPNKPNIHEILGIVRKIPWVVLFSAYIIEEDKIKPEPITDIIVLRLCLLTVSYTHLTQPTILLV